MKKNKDGSNLDMFVEGMEELLVQDTITAVGEGIDVHIMCNTIQNLQDVRLVQVGTFLQNLTRKIENSINKDKFRDLSLCKS